MQVWQPHMSSDMENMTSPASNNKAPYSGVTSRPNLWLHWEEGGGGGESSLRQKANFINYPGDQIKNLEITDINLETRRYGSKSGDSRIMQES